MPWRVRKSRIRRAIPHRNATLRAFVDFATPRLRQRLSTIAQGMARRG